jgi:DNA-binding CsgD family transcriptional regulator
MPRGGDQLLHTIETVHAAGLDETRWPAALASIARLFGARAASLEDFEKRPMGLRYFKTAGIPPQGETAYLEYFARNNSRAQYAFKNLSKRYLYDYEFTDERTMDRDPYYTKYLAALDLRYFLSGQIANTADHQAIVSIQRTRRQGHVERGEIERMELLLPHLRQAYDVSTRLRAALGRARMLEDALGQLGDGVALLDRDGTVFHANDVFAALARRGDGFRVERGSIGFAAAAVQSSFAQSLAALRRCADGDPRFAAATDFLVPRAQGAPSYIASLRPLAGAHRHAHGAVAMLFVRDPIARDSGAARTLIELFGLTEAEAALARALQTGASPVQYARTQGLSVNTVYTHLRRIRDKTGCRRLSELVRKLNELHVPLR